MHLYCAIIFSLYLLSFYCLGTYQNWPSILFCGFMCFGLIGVGHNFLHQPPSLWYNVMDFTAVPSKDWTVSHSLSHHTYANLEIDLEIKVFEPFIYYLTIQPQNPKLAVVYLLLIQFIIPLGQYVRIFIEIFV